MGQSPLPALNTTWVNSSSYVLLVTTDCTEPCRFFIFLLFGGCYWEDGETPCAEHSLLTYRSMLDQSGVIYAGNESLISATVTMKEVKLM